MPPGTVVIPTASVAISRNVDFDFVNPENCDEPAYRISKPVCYELQTLFYIDVLRLFSRSLQTQHLLKKYEVPPFEAIPQRFVI